jgi:hypothetical protein
MQTSGSSGGNGGRDAAQDSSSAGCRLRDLAAARTDGVCAGLAKETSAAELQPGACCTGWLLKRSEHMKKFNKRWFVLWPRDFDDSCGRILFYFAKPTVCGVPFCPPSTTAAACAVSAYSSPTICAVACVATALIMPCDCVAAMAPPCLYTTSATGGSAHQSQTLTHTWFCAGHYCRTHKHVASCGLRPGSSASRWSSTKRRCAWC